MQQQRRAAAAIITYTSSICGLAKKEEADKVREGGNHVYLLELLTLYYTIVTTIITNNK